MSLQESENRTFKGRVDMAAFYSNVVRRPATPVVVIRPLRWSYTEDQARAFMTVAHSLIENTEGADSNTFAEILDAVVVASGILKSEICSRTRCHRPARARNIFYHLCCERTGRSLSRIGNFVGGRDHSTVLSGSGRAASQSRKSGAYQQIIARATAILEGKE
ncbi:MAG: helix-turn-helix domain-containing protein [Aestuariivirga sp.]